MSRWKLVGKVSDFVDGRPIMHDFEYETAALYKIGDKIFALEDRCSHDDGELANGELDGCELVCPRHGARFDIRTGAALTMPATEAVAAYAVKVDGDDVFVEEPEE